MSRYKFSTDILEVVVAQLCQAIGWHSIHRSALEVLTDILQRYLTDLGLRGHRYAEHYNRTEPNLNDFGLVFCDMGIRISELQEYIECVPPIPCVHQVPQYPVKRENHLNWLKPGSREVVTRPMHIHEHLPPMYPEMEDEEYGAPVLTVDTGNSESASPPLSSPKTNVFKRPGDPVQSESTAKRARLVVEEEGRPLREISSVMMTTSGFLSPAREGKLPEARTPVATTDSNSRSNSPQPSPSSYPTVPPEVKGEKKIKKNSPIKMNVDDIKKHDTEGKLKVPSLQEPSVIDNDDDDDSKVKKLVAMKEYGKLKPFKSGALKLSQGSSVASSHVTKNSKSVKNKTPLSSEASSLNVSVSKSSKVQSAKSPKVDLSSTLTSILSQHKIPEKMKISNEIEGKLPSEPDKQKLNIFKKISKVKEDSKFDHSDGNSKVYNENASGGNSGTREAASRLAQIHETIESVIQRIRDDHKKPAFTAASSSTSVAHLPVQDLASENDSFQFDSPPRTPELPILKCKSESKRKKRDRPKESKKSKERLQNTSPKNVKGESSEPEFMEKPKTPEVVTSHDDSRPAPVIPSPSPGFQFFPSFSSTPGLIPQPMGHPSLFPRFPALGKHFSLTQHAPHSGIPNLPIHPLLMLPPRPGLVGEMPSGQWSKQIPSLMNMTPHHGSSSASPADPPVSTQHSAATPNFEFNKGEHYEKQPVQSGTPHSKEKSKEVWKKEHKKEKKEKIKKKKDKKDKIKSKEKSEKRKDRAERKEKAREKLKEKKKKREKAREQAVNVASVTPTPGEASDDRLNTGVSDSGSSGSVPKITFKLGPFSPKPLPATQEIPHRKIFIKPVKKPDELCEEKCKRVEEPNRDPSQSVRGRSPELAKICALVTRPPKQKSVSKIAFPADSGMASGSAGPSKPKKPTSSLRGQKVKSKDFKRLFKESEASEGLAPKPYYTDHEPGTSSSLSVNVSGQAPKKQKIEKASAGLVVDTDGNKVWICPGCGGQDDGSPMIGCDGCDAWYHWVCVGIQVPPDSNDWFCRVCILKKDELVGEKKKKPRKKKSL